jgi:hypothetical protein
MDAGAGDPREGPSDGREDLEPPQISPEEARIDPSQARGAPTPPPAALAPNRAAIGHSEIVAAIREAGTAFRGAAPQVILARWAEDLNDRLDRREEEIADLRAQLMRETEARVRSEEKFAALERKTASEDLLKVIGGAVLGAGIALMVDGKIVLGIAGTILGLVLARFGGASIPRLWP